MTSYESYLDRLGKYDEKQQELDRKLADYHDFINVRILWIQSSTFAALFDYREIDKDGPILFGPVVVGQTRQRCIK